MSVSSTMYVFNFTIQGATVNSHATTLTPKAAKRREEIKMAETRQALCISFRKEGHFFNSNSPKRQSWFDIIA